MKQNWYGVNQDGHIVHLGEHEDIDSADNSPTGAGCTCIADEEGAQEWLSALEKFKEGHRWGKPKQGLLTPEQAMRVLKTIDAAMPFQHLRIVLAAGLTVTVDLGLSIAIFGPDDAREKFQAPIIFREFYGV